MTSITYLPTMILMLCFKCIRDSKFVLNKQNTKTNKQTNKQTKHQIKRKHESCLITVGERNKHGAVIT